jgi:hypothetical protein
MWAGVMDPATRLNIPSARTGIIMLIYRVDIMVGNVGGRTRINRTWGGVERILAELNGFSEESPAQSYRELISVPYGDDLIIHNLGSWAINLGIWGINMPSEVTLPGDPRVLMPG